MSDSARTEALRDRAEQAKPDLVQRGTGWLGIVLAVASVAGIVLALLGYGVALSVQGAFGIPHAAVFSSATDLFNLGGWAIAQGIFSFGDLSTWAFYVDAWNSFWPFVKKLWGMTFSMALAVVVLLGVYWSLRCAGNTPKVQQARTRLRKEIRGKPWFEKLLIGVLTLAIVLTGTPLVILLIFVGLAVVCAAMALVPVAGHSAGQSHIKDWVVDPTACAKLEHRIYRLSHPSPSPRSREVKNRVADCIAVTQGDGKVHKGRLVFATTGTVVLYEPGTASIRRVPIDGAVIESIDAL